LEKLSNNAPFQVDFLKRRSRSFLEIEGKKRGSFDAHPALSCALHAVVVIPMASKPSGVTGGQLALGASDAPRLQLAGILHPSAAFGTAAREQFADRHKTVAVLSTGAVIPSK
jgi:hypothetical protein